MSVNPVESGQGYMSLLQGLQQKEPSQPTSGPSFTNSLREFIGDVNSFQQDSGDITEKFIKGEPVDIHEVMIAAEKAKTSFQLLVEIRNKFMDMYQQVNRIQV